MTLITFLRARLDEDEALARAGCLAPQTKGSWFYGDVDSVAGGSLYDETVIIASIEYDSPAERIDPSIRRTRLEAEADGIGHHIARHDPSHVLRQVFAVRAAVDECAQEPPDFGTVASALAGNVLRHLASAYDDHPDFDPAWRQ